MRLLIAARNRAVGVSDGRIVAPEGVFDVVLEFPDADVRPGLINAHDHLHRNHYGRLGRPPYPNAYAWARDIHAHHRRLIEEGRRKPRREALLAGAWKNLMAGVTTVVHHDPWEPDFDRNFPLRVLPIPSADSLGMTPTLAAPSSDGPYCIHVAEGVDAAAADEVRALDALGWLTPNLVAVHGVGVDAAGVERFLASGAALVWCPSSNLFLFGRTTPPELLCSGVDILLGSDSLLTGAGDLLDELRCARRLNYLSDERLEDAVGAVAARRLGTASPSLDPGAPADLVVLAKPLLEASAGDVLLVVVAGEVRVAAPRLLPALKGLARNGCTKGAGAFTRWISAEPPVGQLAPGPRGAGSPGLLAADHRVRGEERP